MALLSRNRLREWRRWPAEFGTRLALLLLALGGAARQPDGSVRAWGVLKILQVAERLAQRGHEKRPLRAGGLLRYEIGPLPAGPLALDGERPLQKGEPVVILHLDNQSIGAHTRDFEDVRTMTFQGLGLAREDLTALARLARGGRLPTGVRAVWAETVIYRLLARCGFRVREAPHTLRTPFARFYMVGLAALYAGGGRQRIGARARLPRLGEAWISLAELQRRFDR